MRSLGALSFLLLLTTTFGTHAANWKSVPGISNPSFYVDQDSIRRNGDRVTFWTKSDEPAGTPMFFKQPDGSIKTQHSAVAKTVTAQLQYDCREMRQSTGHVTEYIRGNMVMDYDVNLPSSVIEPGTIPENISNFVCKRWYEFWKQ